jgi:hypothetical protein
VAGRSGGLWRAPGTGGHILPPYYRPCASAPFSRRFHDHTHIRVAAHTGSESSGGNLGDDLRPPAARILLTAPQGLPDAHVTGNMPTTKYNAARTSSRARVSQREHAGARDDEILPKTFQSSPNPNGAGCRAVGAQGRSLHDVLSDTVRSRRGHWPRTCSSEGRCARSGWCLRQDVEQQRGRRFGQQL